MRKKLGIVAVALLLSACGGQPAPEQTNSDTAPATVVSSEETSHSEETSAEISTSSLADYLNEHKDSETYHLLYDIALNEDANTISDSDKGITYMFSKDDNGNRILGTVVAYYSDIENMDTSGQEEFCKSFTDSILPELSSFWNKSETYSEGESFGIIIPFDDYSITLMPDNNLDGMTIILSENE